MARRLRDLVFWVLRGVAWTLVVALAIAVAASVTFIPLSYAPGGIQTDFVNGHWIMVGGASLFVVVMVRRLSRTDGLSLVPRDVAKVVWFTTTGMMLAIWPLAFIAWANGYGVHEVRRHDMIVTALEVTHIPPAVTPIQSLKLRELNSGWTADLRVTEAREAFAKVGNCVRIDVRQGRIGLDWISDARPIPCDCDDGAKG
ncbi:MAG: hypothetical protein WC729_12785 [Sphingomonas sp.]|jgi:hypothetical protein|uniref:hypothetical protein n=1 Tax=Sphingomonas sp. TaxID=28214 RepID=UPI00356A7834